MSRKNAEPRPTAIVRENGLVHRSKARGLLNTSNLPALQNLLKREPEAYTEEFLAQWNHYESLRRILASGIGQHVEGTSDASATSLRVSKEQQQQFEQLLNFVTQVRRQGGVADRSLRRATRALLETYRRISLSSCSRTTQASRPTRAWRRSGA